MTQQSSILLTAVCQKPLHGIPGTVLGCDFQPIVPAPFGDLVRVCIDGHDDRSSRDTAIHIAQLLLPKCEGFRHVIVGEIDGSFIVSLRPDDDRHDEVVFFEFHPLISPFLDAQEKHEPTISESGVKQ